MQAVAIVGYKKSGKTSLALELVEEIKRRGVNVACAKHSHHGFDERPGVDTGRFASLGVPVAAWSPGGAFVSWPGERHLPDLIPLLGADFLVCEGGKSKGYMPRVIVADDPESARDLDPELALAVWGKAKVKGVASVKTVKALADVVLSRGFLLPGLDCGGCGRADCAGLCADIVAGKATPADCVSMNGEVRIAVNGHPLALNPFVAGILGAGIGAMVAQLKGFSPGRVEITLEKAGS